MEKLRRAVKTAINVNYLTDSLQKKLSNPKKYSQDQIEEAKI